MKPFHEVLAPLLVGFTVVKVEEGQGREGDLAKITCVNGEVTRTFEVWGGIYGPVASNVQETAGDLPVRWTDVGEMFDNITDHVAKHCADDATIVSVDDALSRGIGFRCVKTGMEWWVGLATVKESKFRNKFYSVASRKVIAASLSNGGKGLLPDLG
jgi:hypothetical protein